MKLTPLRPSLFTRRSTSARRVRPSLLAVVRRALAPLVVLSAVATSRAAELTASDGAANDYFGYSVGLFGNTGLVGAYRQDVGGNIDQGATYLFRNLDTATGTITQTVKLTASDGATNALFGRSVSLSGNTGLIGTTGTGRAYVFRGLDTATGTMTETVKLTASDGANSDVFGFSVSVSGNTGLVGAFAHATGGNALQGAAYLFRNLDTVTGTVTETARLTASDGAAFDLFGYSVSLSGNIGLVGAAGYHTGLNIDQGAAYLFRNLDTATGTVTESAKLIASDGASGDTFGQSVSLSGDTGLVGSAGHNIGGNAEQGAVYLFRNLDTATGTITETVKVYASDGALGDHFGQSVSLDGDGFLIGTVIASTLGKAYSGSVSSLTTLDAGNTSKIISGLSFVSQTDWIIGKNTSGNQVTLSAGDSADVTAPDTKVYIGKNAGALDNVLTIAGQLTANDIHVGESGGGSLFIQNGGEVLSTTGTIAYNLDAVGAATVDGGTWTLTDHLVVGELGQGSLTIKNHGVVNSVGGYIGSGFIAFGPLFFSGEGQVTVDNATWNNTGALYAGLSGKASFFVQNGGQVTSTTAYIGMDARSIGSVVVDGAGSAWTNVGGPIFVGSSGDGTLTVQNGGTVSTVGFLNVANAANSSGTVNIGSPDLLAPTTAGTIAATGILFGGGAGLLNFNQTDFITFGLSIAGGG